MAGNCVVRRSVAGLGRLGGQEGEPGSGQPTTRKVSPGLRSLRQESLFRGVGRLRLTQCIETEDRSSAERCIEERPGSQEEEVMTSSAGEILTVETTDSEAESVGSRRGRERGAGQESEAESVLNAGTASTSSRKKSRIVANFPNS